MSRCGTVALCLQIVKFSFKTPLLRDSGNHTVVRVEYNIDANVTTVVRLRTNGFLGQRQWLVAARTVLNVKLVG